MAADDQTREAVLPPWDFDPLPDSAVVDEGNSAECLGVAVRNEARTPTTHFFAGEVAVVSAAFAIPVVGGVAPEPVPFGPRFSVVMLTGRRPSETTPLAAARESIRRSLWRERRQAAMDAFVASLEQRYHVEERPELMESIVLESARSAPPTRR